MRSLAPPATARRRRSTPSRARSGSALLSPHTPTVLCVAVGAEIEAGILTEGNSLRGADGAAGGLGHIVVPDRRDALCWCGNAGCLTAVAGGTALAGRLGAGHGDAARENDAVELLLELEKSGDINTCTALRTAGWQLGTVLRSCATFLAPDQIVVGGRLALGSSNLRWGLAELYESGGVRTPLLHAGPDDERFLPRADLPGHQPSIAAAG